jgi:hypothetical protein
MAQDIQITKEPGFVRVTYHGDVEYVATTEMLRKVAVVAAETQCKSLLFDIREANYRDYHLGTIRHAEDGPALGIDKTFRIAFLGTSGNPMLKYIEAVTINRGYWAKALTDESEAMLWLCSGT